MKEGLTPSKIDQLLLKLKPLPVVALADDDPQSLDLLERAFRDEGYMVHRFERAEDLVEQFAKIRPDVIVMGAVFSGMSGLSALDTLRPREPEESIPILILSEKEDLKAKLLAFRRGASDYVVKPFEAEEVAARVRTLVRSRMLLKLLQASSLSDPLTLLHNERFLSAWLEREIARVRRYGLALSCLLVDLDHFRRINEEQGERYGDYLLNAFAKILVQNIRSSDLAGRLHNDQFLVLLPGTSKEQAMILARRLRHLAGEQKFASEGKQVKPSFSIGITGCRSEESPTPETFLGRAREALEKAKSVGSGETAVLGLN